MTPLRMIPLAAVLAACSVATFAQTSASSPSRATPPAATPGASAPMVTPEGMTPPRPTPGGAPGSTTMTPQEREQHRQDMQRAKTGAECRAAADKQRQVAAQRAKERGEPPPKEPQVDPCVGR